MPNSAGFAPTLPSWSASSPSRLAFASAAISPASKRASSTDVLASTSLPSSAISSQRSTTRTVSRANTGADCCTLADASGEVAAKEM